MSKNCSQSSKNNFRTKNRQKGSKRQALVSAADEDLGPLGGGGGGGVGGEHYQEVFHEAKVTLTSHGGNTLYCLPQDW